MGAAAVQLVQPNASRGGLLHTTCNGGGSRPPSHGAADDRGGFVNASFEMEIRRRHGADLRAWLNAQLKAPLAAWLRSRRWPAGGTREELVARVIYVIEGT